LREQARRLFALYLVLTASAALGYWLVGMPAFSALCHGFTTLATGGFSTQNLSIGGYQNLGVELVAILFMFLAGCNFLLLLGVLTRRSRSKKTGLLHTVEFRVYLGLMLVVAVGTTVSLWFWGQPVRDDSLGITHNYSEFGRCLRDGVFQTVSIFTSTGYSTANFEDWPKPALYLLVVGMFIGGCTGSTAGGFKVLRVVVCMKLIGYSLRQFIQPRTVEKLRVGPDLIPNSIVSAILALLLLWMMTVAAGTFVLDLDPRLDLVSAFTASLSMTGCVGPSISEVVPGGVGTFELVGQIDLGPYNGYGDLHPWTKLFMSLQMILGRLEILAPFVLLTPGFWRR
jgi:trk system potassium uptake protein TrkH